MSCFRKSELRACVRIISICESCKSYSSVVQEYKYGTLNKNNIATSIYGGMKVFF